MCHRTCTHTHTHTHTPATKLPCCTRRSVIAEKYGLELPKYPGSEQVVALLHRIPIGSAATGAAPSTSGAGGGAGAAATQPDTSTDAKL